MHITIIAGARPNFMKIAPIIHEIQNRVRNGIQLTYRLVHTGQHFDAVMSGNFFEELEIPKPDALLHAGGGTQAEQTAAVMVGVEKELGLHPTNLMIVVGDVTSTMAAAITARKMMVPVAHIEAGIRSRDWSMPEEINRIVTDSISNYFFTTSKLANENLYKEGKDAATVFFVGNTMIDTLIRNLSKLKKPFFFDQLSIVHKEYIVLTLHRPSNVDDKNQLQSILEMIVLNSKNLPILFPVHPRTKKNIENFGLNYSKLIFLEPLSYLEFNYLVKNSLMVITDSGGITEETTVMQVPCVTLRDSTERPETVTMGTNELVGSDAKKFELALAKIFAGDWKKGSVPELWDGKTAQRIVEIIQNI